MQRIKIAGLLGLLLLTAVSCSSTSGVVPAGTGGADATRFGKAHVAIAQFADLPDYPDYYGPAAIASDPKHSLWVTDTIDQDAGENAVVQIATSGKALNTFYYQGVVSEGSDLMDLTEGHDGALWITDDYNGQILRMTTAGTFTSYPLSTIPFHIVDGPDRALWFTASGGSGGTIDRITTQGQITQYTAAGDPWGIAVGSDGALWYTETSANAVARITTKGKITVYTKGISTGADPYLIAAGPDGALWFTEHEGGRIGRITTQGRVTEYSRGITPGEKPIGIAAGPDGAMWFTESESNDSGYYEAAKIGRITMSGKVTQYSKGLTSNSQPTAIVQGPDHNMWFVEYAANKTGRAKL